MEKIQHRVYQCKDYGIVEDTQSLYVSPVFLMKKLGETRMVIDYQRLNGQTIRQSYRLPHMHDLLEKLYGSIMFMILGLAHGYLQIPLAVNAKLKTV